jgi:hypothetical protein
LGLAISKLGLLKNSVGRHIQADPIFLKLVIEDERRRETEAMALPAVRL